MRHAALLAERLDRATATQALPESSARVLQRCDTARLGGGRIVRAFGCAKTAAAPIAATVNSLFTAHTPNGDPYSVVGSNGNVYAFKDPKNQWADSLNSWNGQPIDEDWGFDEALFSINGSAVYTTLIDGGGAQARYCGAMWYNRPKNEATPTDIAQQPLLWVGGHPSNINDTGHYIANARGIRASGPTTLSGVGTITQIISGVCGAGVWEQGRIFWQSNVTSYSEGIILQWVALQKIFVINDTGASGTVLPGGTFNASARTVFVRKAR